MAKNKIKKIIKVKEEESEMGMRTLIITFAVMIVLSLGAYYLTEGMIEKKKSEGENTTIAEIDYNQILLGNIFDIKDKEYYVMVYDYEDKQIEFFDEIKQNYINTPQTKLYTSNLKEALNKTYISDISNPKAKTLNELKISQDTLIFIKDGKINKFLEGPNKIKEELNVSDR